MMCERIKDIRASKDMSQADFSKLLGIGQSTLAMMEVGKRNISERHIKTICSICGVSERWLRTGEGEMYIQTDSSLMDQLRREYNLDGRRAAAVESFLELEPEMQDALLDGIFALVDNIRKSKIDKEVDNYRVELEAQEKARSRSDGIEGTDIEKKA